MAEEKSISVRFPAEVKDKLKEISDKSEISQNALVVISVKELIRQYEGEGIQIKAN